MIVLQSYLDLMRLFYGKSIIYRLILYILSVDNIFLECDIARGMVFRGRKSGITHNFTMDVNPVFKYVEKFPGGVQWYLMETKDFISIISFKLKKWKQWDSFV